MKGSDSNVTDLLHRWANGDETVEAQLFDAVYGEFRKIAARHMRRERPDHTLQPTALVHEAYIRLFGQGPVPIGSRGHLAVLASRAMRRILVDHARSRKAEKHGGNLRRAELEDNVAAVNRGDDELLAVHAALDSLVECRRGNVLMADAA